MGNSTSFKPGDGRERKPKGAISEKTKFWNELSDFVINSGAEKFKAELMKLEGKDFITAYSNVLEFFKPKLARQEIKTDAPVDFIRSYTIIPASEVKKEITNSMEENNKSISLRKRRFPNG